ncbi:MAG: NAD(P)-dependent oxidoreductase [Candidatus Saganbacteria bacterium]|nr:NAD(P)-dependent oxidoreductase [Candidatus Saganbacteria bacterium]
MKVLVTGNNGYIGNVMCPMLLSEGFDVVGLDSNYFEGCEFEQRQAKIGQIVKDIRQVAAEDFQGVDAVIHLAGLSNDPIGELNPGITEKINLDASVRCAQLAKQAGVKRFVFASSCSVYGVAKEGEMISEQGELNPVTAYAKSKIGTEFGISPLAEADFSPVFMRNATVYGVSPLLRLDLVVNNLAAWGHITGKIKIMSDGSPWRPLIHIQDFSRAFIAALKAPKELVHNQVFNVGQNSENYQIRYLAAAVKQVIPGCSVEYTGEHGSDSRTYKVDFSKINTVLKDHFKPKWNVLKGVEELAEAYKRNKLDMPAFEGDKFVRLRHLTLLKKSGKLDNDFFWTEKK